MMIDQKQIEKSNSEKKSRQEEIKETGYKDAYGSKKHCFNNKLTENIKINSQEHSFNDGKHYSSDFLNDGQTSYKNPLKVNNNHLEENMMGTFNAFKNESNKPKKIEYFDYNSELSDKFNRFNYFLLPKYGLEEKSIQTDLSGRDIDNLKYLSEEFSSLKEEFLLNFIYNHPDVLKKLYYNALKKKETSTHVKVNIKRRINTKPHEKKNTEIKPKVIEKKKLTPTIFEEKSQENETNVISKQLAEEAFKRSFSDTSLIKVGNTSNLLNINKNSNVPTTIVNTNPQNIMKEDISPVSENFLNKKHLMENLLDSLDKVRKEDQNINSDSPSASQSVSFQKKEFQQDKTFKKQISLEKKLSKIQKKQQFDPFKFFKEEYMHSHPDLDSFAIEQGALREWNDMAKDLKKIYHNIADQEKKKQKKLNKTKEADLETNSTTKNMNN